MCHCSYYVLCLVLLLVSTLYMQPRHKGVWIRRVEPLEILLTTSIVLCMLLLLHPHHKGALVRRVEPTAPAHVAVLVCATA
jgi:hypothetical protein